MGKITEVVTPLVVVACVGIACFTAYKIAEIKSGGGWSRAVVQNTEDISELARITLDITKELRALKERKE